LHGRRNPFVAHEGVAWLAAVFTAAILVGVYLGLAYAVLPGIAFVLLFLLFRDPLRSVPSVALGVISPVDGTVTEVGRIEKGEAGVAVLRVQIEIDSFGTYTARAPVEGNIREMHKKALWLQTDEGQDVVIKFSDYRFGLPPKSFARYGERLGQGQRCAYLRFTRFVEVQFPVDGKILVEPGQKVVAGVDLIGSVLRS
jgi:phosphatidylserine decarboxylase